jgi:hypothetical protein
LAWSLAQVYGDWIDKVSRAIFGPAAHGIAHDAGAAWVSRTVFPAADFVTIAGANNGSA